MEAKGLGVTWREQIMEDEEREGEIEFDDMGFEVFKWRKCGLTIEN